MAIFKPERSGGTNPERSEGRTYELLRNSSAAILHESLRMENIAMDRRLQKKHAKAVRRNVLKTERAAAEVARRRRDSLLSEDSEMIIRLTEKGQREFATLFPEPNSAESIGASSPSKE